MPAMLLAISFHFIYYFIMGPLLNLVKNLTRKISIIMYVHFLSCHNRATAEQSVPTSETQVLKPSAGNTSHHSIQTSGGSTEHKQTEICKGNTDQSVLGNFDTSAHGRFFDSLICTFCVI